MNYDRVPHGLKWMQTTSFFHAGYEALLVNELRYLQLIEHKVSWTADVVRSPVLNAPLAFPSLVWIYKYPRQPSCHHLVSMLK
jgi:hypothetical protein